MQPSKFFLETIGSNVGSVHDAITKQLCCKEALLPQTVSLQYFAVQNEASPSVAIWQCQGRTTDRPESVSPLADDKRTIASTCYRPLQVAAECEAPVRNSIWSQHAHVFVNLRIAARRQSRAMLSFCKLKSLFLGNETKKEGQAFPKVWGLITWWQRFMSVHAFPAAVPITLSHEHGK